MIRLNELRLPLEHSDAALREAVVARLGIDAADLRAFSIFRRGDDARKKAAIVFVHTIVADVADAAAVLARHRGDPHVRPAPDTTYRFVASAPADFAPRGRPRPVGSVGFGPCGIFAALLLAQMVNPLVLERGRAVREAERATPGACGGAASSIRNRTCSSAKAVPAPSPTASWSQISYLRHLTRKVTDEFDRAGAPEEIRFVAKPHIGTFRLVAVERMRHEIERLGGEIRFGARVVDLRIENGAVRGVTVEQSPAREASVATGTERHEIDAEHVVVALGHMLAPGSFEQFDDLSVRGLLEVLVPEAYGPEV